MIELDTRVEPPVGPFLRWLVAFEVTLGFWGLWLAWLQLWWI